MTEGVNLRELALDILTEVTENGAYSHTALRAALEKYQYLNRRERAFVTRLTEGTIQRMIELDAILDRFSSVKTAKMKPLIRNILRMGVYQLKYMDSVPAGAACNEAVKLAKKRGFSALGGFVNGVLRGTSRGLEQFCYPDRETTPETYFSVRYSMPEWIVRQWLSDYGEERTGQMLSAFLKEAPLTVRANLSKTTPERLMETLAREGVTATPADRLWDAAASVEGGKSGSALIAPKYAFAILGYDYIGKLESFREGLFYVQDISSMLAAEIAAPKKGSTVLDVCAAPGGKSIHLAEMLQGTGSVIACDLTEAKVSLIDENIARCGLTNIRSERADATVYREEFAEAADLVVADLPCSGLGVLRKKTDVKYKMTPEKERELSKLQRRILDNVCRYVKAGGALLYSTCTVDKAENEDNAAYFLAAHQEFSLVEQRQIFPGEKCGDGFFFAKFQKARE